MLQFTEEKMENAFISTIRNNLVLILSLGLVATTIGVFHYLGWWEVIGLVILNFGLGIKVKGATTLAATIAKSGGKKALFMTTGGVLLKRHIIDLSSKFFAEHSVSRYKSNIMKLIKMKINDIKNSTPMQKAKAIGSTLMSIPILYFFWSKVLGTAIQKFIYALVLPLFSALLNVIMTGFSFLAGLFVFILQLTFLNILIDKMEKSVWGKAILNAVMKIFSFLGDILDYMNKGFIWLGFDPKHYLILKSIHLNRWLEDKVNRGVNGHKRIEFRREFHMNCRDKLLMRRELKKAPAKIKMKKKVKELYRLKVKKKLTWKEKRQKRIDDEFLIGVKN